MWTQSYLAALEILFKKKPLISFSNMLPVPRKFCVSYIPWMGNFLGFIGKQLDGDFCKLIFLIFCWRNRQERNHIYSRVYSMLSHTEETWSRWFIQIYWVNPNTKTLKDISLLAKFLVGLEMVNFCNILFSGILFCMNLIVPFKNRMQKNPKTFMLHGRNTSESVSILFFTP